MQVVAVASQRAAFRHVLQHHLVDGIPSDDEISARISVMIEEDVPASKSNEIFGLAYPPFMTWSRRDNCLDYLRAVVYLTDHQYELERHTTIFGTMYEQVLEEFQDVTNFDQYVHAMETRQGSIKLLTFLTGEIHPEPKFSFEGVDWPAVDNPQAPATPHDWLLSDQSDH